MKAKQFDCVEMKRDIQEKLQQEIGGLEPAEARAAQRRLLESDPDMASFLQSVADRHRGARPSRE